MNVAGTFEAIDNFAYVDVQATSARSSFRPSARSRAILPMPPTTGTLQTYVVSPYIRGRIPGSNVSYQVRDDNIWTASTQFGGSSPRVPTTYSNGLTGSMSAPASPWGWTLEYSLYYYENGFSNARGGRAEHVTTTTQAIRLILPYQIDPQLQIAPRIGYESNTLNPGPRADSQGTIYGIGGQWNPTDRTQVSGFWEHRVLRRVVLGASQPPPAELRDQRKFLAGTHQLSPARAGHSGGHDGQPVPGCRVHDADPGSRGARRRHRTVSGADGTAAHAGGPGELLWHKPDAAANGRRVARRSSARATR